MSWFKILKYGINPETQTPTNSDYLYPPLRRKIYFNNLTENISAGEQVYVHLDNNIINSYTDSLLVNNTDDNSYVVVLQDEEDDEYFQPVKSYVDQNILFFILHENIEKDITTTKYYCVYYGSKRLNIISQQIVGDIIYYVQENPDLIISQPGNYFDLEFVDTLSYTADTVSDGNYKLALFNSGTDWIDNVSQISGAKAFGIFDGPDLTINGSTGPEYSKFKIRIFPYEQSGQISSTPIIDWMEINCYDTVNTSSTILYTGSNLEYSKYIFEVETLSNKDIMSYKNSVKIDSYSFLPNYGFSYDKEEINPNISFIKIAGIR